TITGVPGEQLKRIAETFATQKPATIIWCMGQTHHTVGTANTRASCILCLATGNVGKPGTGANIFRGHDNVQGATDIGLDVVTLTRWFDAVSLPKEDVAQPDTMRSMFVQGHASNSIARIPESIKGLAGLDLLVVADPHPTTWASLAVKAGRMDNTYLLPVCTQFETSGSRVASNRALQWGEQIVPPSFEQKDDYQVLFLLSKKLGIADWMFKNIKVEGDRPVPEDVLREM